MSDIFFSPWSLVFSLAALLIAITIHEFSHAVVADRLGDPTARLAGRVTLNPLAHLDVYGSLLFLFLLLSRSPIIFGWGKPVPFDPFNLKNPKRDSALISLAGPASNILLATVASLCLRIADFLFVGSAVESVVTFFQILIVTNIVLAIFNILPIHPLDGFKIVGGLLPDDRANEWHGLAQYGIFFLIILLLPLPGGSILSNILFPVISVFLTVLLPR